MPSGNSEALESVVESTIEYVVSLRQKLFVAFDACWHNRRCALSVYFANGMTVRPFFFNLKHPLRSSSIPISTYIRYRRTYSNWRLRELARKLGSSDYADQLVFARRIHTLRGLSGRYLRLVVRLSLRSVQLWLHFQVSTLIVSTQSTLPTSPPNS